MSRLLRLPLLVAVVLASVLGTVSTPAEATEGVHYLSIASTQPNPQPNIGEPYLADPGASESAGAVVFRIFFSTDPTGPGTLNRDHNVSVKYTTHSGTAEAGADFTQKSDTVTLRPDQDHVDISIPVNNDNFAEDNEWFRVVLTNPNNASIQDGESVGHIMNDDGAPPTLSINDPAPVLEGNGGTTPIVFTVTLGGSAAQQVVKVDYKTKDGTAVAPSDYTAKNGTLTFAVGETTKPIEVPINGDLTVEHDETFTVELSLARNAAISDASGTGTIQSDDLPRDQITTAPGRTGGPHVRIFDPAGVGNDGFLAYEAGFDGGIRVARGDFIGNDGVQEIITAPCCYDVEAQRRFANGRCCFNYSQSRPLVRVFSQQGRLLTQWFAYDQNFTGGVTIASGNIDPRAESPGDEVVTAPGPGGGPHVRVWRIGSTPGENGFLPVFEVNGFFAYDPAFTNGVNVAVGDVVREVGGQTDPVREEIVTTPMAGGGPHVQIQGVEVVNQTARGYSFGFMAYDPAFRGGLSVATGNFDSDGEFEIVTGALKGGGPHVRTFNANKPGRNGIPRNGGFMAYDPAFTGGINVSAGNTQGTDSSIDEVITGAGVGGGPHVQQFSPDGDNLFGFMAYDINFRGGVVVAYGGGE